MDERILITGSGSIVASHVIRHLVALPAVAGIVGVDPVGHHPYLPSLGKDIPVFPLDIRDEAGLTRVMRQHRVTGVFHVAAVLGPWHNDNPLGSIDVNLGGSMNVLEAAHLSGVNRVVFASTKSVYDGLAESSDFLTEEQVLPTRPYTIGKVAAELMGRQMAAAGVMEFAALRFADFLCSEFCQRDTYLRAGAAFTLSKAIVAGRYGAPVRIRASADALTDPFYAGDLGLLVSRLIVKERLSHTAYNVGAGAPGISYRDAIGILADRYREDCYTFEDTGECVYRPGLDTTRISAETGSSADHLPDFLDRMEADIDAARSEGLLPETPGRWIEQREAVELLSGEPR